MKSRIGLVFLVVMSLTTILSSQDLGGFGKDQVERSAKNAGLVLDTFKEKSFFRVISHSDTFSVALWPDSWGWRMSQEDLTIWLKKLDGINFLLNRQRANIDAIAVTETDDGSFSIRIYHKDKEYFCPGYPYRKGCKDGLDETNGLDMVVDKNFVILGMTSIYPQPLRNYLVGKRLWEIDFARVIDMVQIIELYLSGTFCPVK